MEGKRGEDPIVSQDWEIGRKGREREDDQVEFHRYGWGTIHLIYQPPFFFLSLSLNLFLT